MWVLVVFRWTVSWTQTLNLTDIRNKFNYLQEVIRNLKEYNAQLFVSISCFLVAGWCNMWHFIKACLIASVNFNFGLSVLISAYHTLTAAWKIFLESVTACFIDQEASWIHKLQHTNVYSHITKYFLWAPLWNTWMHVTYLHFGLLVLGYFAFRLLLYRKNVPVYICRCVVQEKSLVFME